MQRWVAIAVLVSAGAVSAQTPGFWLTGLAPTTTSGSAPGLSQDGLVAVGGSSNGTIAPGFSWTRSGGRYDFGLEPGMPTSTYAFATDALGQTIVGSMSDSQHSPRAYRRVGNAPLENLGVLPNELRSYAQGVSGDGSVIVGRCEHTTMGNAYGQAFRWTQGGGMQGLGYLRPDGTFSESKGISRDGTTIVGVSQSGGPFGGPAEGFVWTAANGMRSLPTLPNANIPDTEAEAVNRDGSVVVGVGNSSDGRSHAIRWTSAGAQDLGLLPSGRGSVAYAVSDDGSVIAGSATVGSNMIAMVWMQPLGMVRLRDYLAGQGVSVPAGVLITTCYAVSGDGRTFAGIAQDTATSFYQGFVATIPAPSTLIVSFSLFALRRRRGSS